MPWVPIRPGRPCRASPGNPGGPRRPSVSVFSLSVTHAGFHHLYRCTQPRELLISDRSIVNRADVRVHESRRWWMLTLTKDESEISSNSWRNDDSNNHCDVSLWLSRTLKVFLCNDDSSSTMDFWGKDTVPNHRIKITCRNFIYIVINVMYTYTILVLDLIVYIFALNSCIIQFEDKNSKCLWK